MAPDKRRRVGVAVALSLAFVLAGCATTRTGYLANYARACASYAASQQLIIANAGKIHAAGWRIIKQVTDRVSPICETTPANPQAATVEVSAAVAQLSATLAAEGIVRATK